MNAIQRALSTAATLVAAAAFVTGCLPIDYSDHTAQLMNRSHESFTVPITGSSLIALAPAFEGGGLHGEHGPIADTECVGEGFSIVDSTGAVRATYDRPVCPDTIITIAEDGTISVRSGGKALTPVPDPTSTS